MPSSPYDVGEESERVRLALGNWSKTHPRKRRGNFTICATTAVVFRHHSLLRDADGVQDLTPSDMIQQMWVRTFPVSANSACPKGAAYDGI